MRYTLTYKKPELDTITPSTNLTTQPLFDTMTPPSISVTPPRTPSPSRGSSLTLTPPNHLPFRNLRVRTPRRPLRRKSPPPAAPFIFPASIWRDALPMEPPVPVRGTFPFHMPDFELSIDTVLANAVPQGLRVSAPRRAKFSRKVGVRHAQPVPYSLEDRMLHQLVRLMQRLEQVERQASAALDLALKETEKSSEDMECSVGYRGGDLPERVSDEDGGDESEYEGLLVSDAGDDEVTEHVESGEDDVLTGFEKLVRIVSEDSDGGVTLEQRKSFEILGSLL